MVASYTLKLHAETIELLSHVDDADFLLPPRTSTGAGKPLKDRRSDGTLVRDKWKLVGFDLIPLRPNLSDERGIRIFRVSDALHIDVALEQSQKQMPFAALLYCREILDVRFQCSTNLLPSQPVGSCPLLKIIEATFRLPLLAFR